MQMLGLEVQQLLCYNESYILRELEGKKEGACFFYDFLSSC